MKQALVLLAAVAATAAITYLIVTNRQLGNQLGRVNQALAQAQERSDVLQAQLESARRRLLAWPAPAPTPPRATPPPARTTTPADSPPGPVAGLSTHLTTVRATEAVQVGAIPVPVGVAGLGQSWTQYEAQPGSEVHVAGTVSRQDWELNGNVIGGRLWLPTGLESNPCATVATWSNTLPCRGSAVIPVRTLKSYARKMDEMMASSLQADQFPRIEFHLSGLQSDAFATNGSRTLLFQSIGELVIHGVTNALEMPITILVGQAGQLRVSGSTVLLLTDFGVQPPERAGDHLKTDNEIKVSFIWQLKRTATLGTD